MSDWSIDGKKFSCWNGDSGYHIDIERNDPDQLWFTLTTYEDKYGHEKVERQFGISGRNLEAFAYFVKDLLEENRLRDLVKEYWRSVIWKRQLGAEWADDKDYIHCMKEMAEELGISIDKP